ncbi:DUF3299 domain-containing protein [Labrenzia sp. PHM005]|uniref:DUF3299 domain-containing protein n=1 Tax=Labrenzia sp. PHM005 TaxID=2590016 RepID=UPI0011407F8F|nr:DUF3299 domain-containing protein [Labrenzia sp. PHM005]QDG75144.1 DUF3299 domain-containing protein [Labrenzia sp. PHM005]
MMRYGLILLMSVLTAFPAVAVTPIDWIDLKDPAAARFEDPFEALFLTDLRSIAAVYRLRKLLERGDLTDDDRSKAETRLRQEEQKLTDAGIETDLLLAQREAVAKKKAEALLKGNPDLVGKDIAITGYVIPVIGADGSAQYGYLVSGYGMCSHVPAPPPNQTIYYKLQDDWSEAELYKPVLLSGRLDMNLSRQTITLLDGQVTITAAFDMDVSEIRPINDTGSTADQRSFRTFRRPN